MWILTEVRITFDPVKEQDRIQSFSEQNDLREWKEDFSSRGYTFAKKQVLHVGEEKR